MQKSLAQLLQRLVDRTNLPVSRISSQAGIPKQTLFNWLGGRTPRWHPQLPTDLQRLSLALGLAPEETDELLLAAGCICAVDTPFVEEEAKMRKMKLPKGWFCAGSHPQEYHMGIDPKVKHEDAPTASVQSKKKTADGFGTLMQSCQPGKFIGERVRISALARTGGIKDWAGLWFRIDGPEEGKSLNFDNMSKRPLKGTTDWQRYSVVLDVSEEATALAFGILLSGEGSVWIADMKFEIVGPDVPSTNMTWRDKSLPEEPANLDFRE